VALVSVLLGGLLWAFVSPTRRVRSYLSCSQNLKQFGLATRLFADDHRNLPPWEFSTNEGGTLEFRMSGEQTFRHFQAQSNYIIAWPILVCPQDTRKAAKNWENLANTNVSYFVGLDSKPSLDSSILAGDRNIASSTGTILQVNEQTPLQWVKSVGLHGDRGHLVFGDGHVEELDSVGWSNAVQRTGIETNRFTVP
jgi:prepilin-type processing-associated H-X9-DG protein